MLQLTAATLPVGATYNANNNTYSYLGYTIWFAHATNLYPMDNFGKGVWHVQRLRKNGNHAHLYTVESLAHGLWFCQALLWYNARGRTNRKGVAYDPSNPDHNKPCPHPKPAKFAGKHGLYSPRIWG